MGQVTIRYLGHSAFQLRTPSGKNILVDPFISENPATPVAVEELFDVDLVLITHGARDHFGDSERILKESGATAVCAPEVFHYLKGRGIPEKQMKLLVWGGVLDVQGVPIRAVENRHVSHVWRGDDLWTGMPLSFVLNPDPDVSVYHAGDTSIFSALRLIAELSRPNVVLLPVGAAPGYFPELPPNEAALATVWLRPDLVIPMHFESESSHPAEYKAAMAHLLPDVRVECLQPGQTVVFRRSIEILPGETGS